MGGGKVKVFDLAQNAANAIKDMQDQAIKDGADAPEAPDIAAKFEEVLTERVIENGDSFSVSDVNEAINRTINSLHQQRSKPSPQQRGAIDDAKYLLRENLSNMIRDVESARDILGIEPFVPGDAGSSEVSQSALAERVSSVAPDTHQFIKDKPVMMYRITAENVHDLPKPILQELGKIDKAKYEKEGSFEKYMESRIGGAVVLQFNKDAPDFYPIPPKVFNGKYATVDIDDVKTKNSALFESLSTMAGVGDLIGAAPDLVAALKTVPVDMYKASELGFPVERELVIDAPWGGTQTKPSGQDAYIVPDGDGEKHYMCNAAESGLPIGYQAVGAEGNEPAKQSQADLVARVSSAEVPTYQFIKSLPQVMYRLTPESLDTMPESILSNQGLVDNATYQKSGQTMKEFLKDNYMGGAIGLQTDGKGNMDFYPVLKKVVDNEFESVPMDDVQSQNGELVELLSGMDGVQGFAADARFAPAKKKAVPVEMRKASELGFSLDQELVIEAPWGGEQKKPAGKDCFIIRDPGYEAPTYYMCNTQDSGLPIGYSPVS